MCNIVIILEIICKLQLPLKPDNFVVSFFKVLHSDL